MKNFIRILIFAFLLNSIAFGVPAKKTKIKIVPVNKLTVNEIKTQKKAVRVIPPASMFNRTISKKKLPLIPSNCKELFKADYRRAKAKFNQCLAAINQKWDSLSNTQMVQLCGNNGMQECYVNFVDEEKKKCMNQFNGALAKLARKYKNCK